MSQLLIDLINLFAAEAPQEIVERVCHVCDTSSDWTRLESIHFHSPQLQQQFTEMKTLAQKNRYTTSHIALALRSAKLAMEHSKNTQKIDLVWTGPELEPFTLRRTDETLLQLISQAKQSLMLVSFAVYKVERVLDALEQAISRKVRIQLFLETDDNKITGAREQMLQMLPSAVQVYTWSAKERYRNEFGHYGALHAKLAIADNMNLLVSSANLTEHALSLNIEIGILVEGGLLPAKINRLLENLLAQKIFVKLK